MISNYTTVYLLKNKSDAFEKFQDFLKEVKNQFSRKKKKEEEVIEAVSMNQVHSTHLFSLWELSMKVLYNLLLMVWLKEKIKL